MMNPFTPGGTASLDYTDATAQVALPAKGGMQVRIVSPAGNDLAFINFGTSDAVTAAVTDTPILPGTIEVFTIPPAASHVAAIAGAAGTGTLYFTRGDGQ